MHPIHLAPGLPGVKKNPVQTNILLRDFEDARPKAPAPEWIGQWRNHSFIIDQPVAIRMSGMIRSLMQESGIKVSRLKGEEPAGASLVLSGKLEEMKAELRNDPFQAPLVCVIRLRLSLERDGRAVAKKTIDVEHLRRGFSVMGDESYEKVVNEAFEKFLDEAADYFETDEFAQALARGKP